MDNAYILKPIGIIHSPYKEIRSTPKQAVFSEGVKGKIIINREYVRGLKGLEKFSYIYLFFYFDRSSKTDLQLTPHLSNEEKGVFATRSPRRPNKLGMSLVELTGIEDNIIHIRDLDILDGTPLIDIKPFVKQIDTRE